VVPGSLTALVVDKSIQDEPIEEAIKQMNELEAQIKLPSQASYEEIGFDN
jgi:hypothetical protein